MEQNVSNQCRVPNVNNRGDDMKRRILEGKRLEWAALLLFAAAYAVISAFHEPWFDEAQAWQIAKCASLREILFEIPHYEGHPPLWHLILAIPAKLGIPFELGLKSVGFLISAASAALILFKMPYPRLMRLLIPFSYFIFYQYGVIVRPYGLMLLAFLLLAIAFPQRDRKPWLFCGLLFLLCLTSAYGIVLAGGVAISWVWELLKETGRANPVAALLRDKRTYALAALLAAALLLIWQIMPHADTLVTSRDRENSFLLCFLCAMFTFMGECTLTTSSWFDIDRVLLQHVYISRPELIAFCVIGIFLWALVICLSSRRALKYALVPYVMLSAFAAAVYFSVHHVGVVLNFFLFWFGVLFQDEQRFEIGRGLVAKLAKTERDRRLFRKALPIIGLACLLIPIYWTVHASVLEVQLEYSYGRSGSAFFKDHALEECLTFSTWGQPKSDEILLVGMQPMENTYYVGAPVLLNAYLDRNICYNLNEGKDREAYLHYRVAGEAGDLENLSRWKERGVPDLILGRPMLTQVFDELSYDDYAVVAFLPINYIWKNSISRGRIPVYARKELLEKHHLSVIYDSSYSLWAEGFQITDEMREEFNNGVPMEEILKPYLDAMFGAE